MNAFFSSWQPMWQTSSLWHTAGWTMCLFLVLGTLVALAGAVFRLLFSRSTPTMRYTISLVVFATLSALPVAITIWLSQASPTALAINNQRQLLPLPTHEIKQSHSAPHFGWKPTPAAPTTTNPDPSQPEAGAIYSLTFPQAIAYLPWLWIVGAPITFALLATGLIGTERLRRGCTPIASGAVLEAADRALASLRVGRQVGIALCDRIARPVLVGILRPLILLPPAALSGWSPEQLEMVLLHELAHVRRWDNLINLLQRLVESLLFFHPAIWLVSRQVRRDREQCCDAVVVAHTAKPQAYAELLLSIASKGSQTPAFATASAMADHPLASRIRHILKLEDESMLVSRRTLGIFSLAAITLIATMIWRPLDSSSAEEVAHVAVEQDENNTEGKTEPTNQVVPDAGPNSPFLSLEKQRLVDLAFNALGIELEHLSADDFAHVKSSEFEGGLRVDKSDNSAGIGVGDILVGLHVWPTKSLEEVAKILQRDDIAELSPLKFFVLRPGNVDGSWSSKPSENLITGRVPVNLIAVAKRPSTQTPTQASSIRVSQEEPLKIAPGDEVLVRVEGEFPDQPIDDTYHVGPTGTLPLGPTYGRVRVAGKTLLEAEDVVTKHLEKMLSEVAVQISWLSPKNDKSTLLYDGKTFEQWRGMWKTELKTENRTECINALAAFARAGHAKEAAETILDVAGEYDFELIDHTPEGHFKQRVLDVLSQQISSSHWLTPLIERYDSEPKRWEHLANWLVLWLHSLDAPTRQQLLELADSDHSFHKKARVALLGDDRNLQRPETVELAREALQGEHPDMSMARVLDYRHLDKVPERFELLFHQDPEIRKATRQTLPPSTASRQIVIDKLLDVLNDPAQAKKHVYAIRALSLFGNGAQNNKQDESRITTTLLRTIRQGDMQLLVPAIAAYGKIYQFDLPTTIDLLLNANMEQQHGPLSEDRKKLLNDTEQIEKLLHQELQQTTPPDASIGGRGGGGGASGGGGGFF